MRFIKIKTFDDFDEWYRTDIINVDTVERITGICEGLGCGDVNISFNSGKAVDVRMTVDEFYDIFSDYESTQGKIRETIHITSEGVIRNVE